jgi:hypothetical protein
METLPMILSFLFAMGIVSIPIIAIVTRKNSPIGQAMAERIRLRTLRHHTAALPPGHQPPTTAGGHAAPLDAAERETQRVLIEAQDAEIRDLSEKVEFLQKLIEKEQKKDR